jgi:RimJ/RimL family protein N-acetyltransferase
MAFITGKTIGLRGFFRSDLPDYRRWLATYEVNRYLEMGSRPLSDADLEAVYCASAETSTNYAFIIERLSDGAAIGTAGIWDVNWLARRGDFRIIIGDVKAMGCGFGKETLRLLMEFAFCHLNLQVLTLGFNAENKAAEKTYSATGFVFEGRRRRLLYRNGQYYDVVYMSMLREEYEGCPSVAED